MTEEIIRKFFEGLNDLLDNQVRETQKQLDNFFSNLKFRLDIFQETKKGTDVSRIVLFCERSGNGQAYYCADNKPLYNYCCYS